MKKIKASVNKITGERAFLYFGNEDLEIPRNILSEDTKEGDNVFITITNTQEEGKNREERAKDLLNEVLGEE